MTYNSGVGSTRQSGVEGSLMRFFGSSCIFCVPDIGRTTAYYRDVLGFSAVEYLQCAEPHICLYRDGVEILLLQSTTSRVMPNRELYGYGYDAYLYVDEQERLLAELSSRGAHIVRPLAVTDYRNREFVVEDIDGRWLAFGLKEPTTAR